MEGKMRKITIILAVLILIGILLTSCQKAKETESKKEVQVQQTQKEETKPEVQTEKQEQPTVIPQAKEEKKEKPVEIIKSPLTDVEQKFVEKIGGDIPSPNLFKSQEAAVRYLKILLKGDEKTIRWYVNFAKKETESYVKRAYADDLCIAMEALALKHNKAFELILEVMKDKSNYPSTYACASKMIGWYAIKEGKTERVKETIPLLKEAIKQNDFKVRLEAAGSLLSSGEANVALPVLDELAKQGKVEALAKLFEPDKEGAVHWSKLKFWDKRGLEIIKKALDYPSEEVKAWAAMALVNLDIEKAKAEAVAFSIVKNLMYKKWNEYGISWDDKRGIVPLPGYEKKFNELHEKYTSDVRACDRAMGVLGRLKSKKAVPSLRYIQKNNTEAGNVCWENLADKTAEHALERILENGGGK